MVRSQDLWANLIPSNDSEINWEHKIIVVDKITQNHVFLKTLTKYVPFVSISHRWKSAPKSENVTVHVLDEDKEVAQWSTKVDVNALKLLERFTTQCAPVWLDLVCICQNNPVHKSAQVSIMGAIFSLSLTIIVDEDFQARPPAQEYWERVWTFQEYRFGAALPLYFLGSEDFKETLDNMGFTSHGDYIIACLFNNICFHDHADWRYEAYVSDKSKFGPYHRDLNEMRWFAELDRRDFLPFLKSLGIASLISRIDFGEISEKQYFNNCVEMKRSSCTYDKDRLFGIWGVTVQILSGCKLDYTNPNESLNIIKKLCNLTSDVAFMRDDHDPLCLDGYVLSIKEQIKSIPPGKAFDDDFQAYSNLGNKVTLNPRVFEVPMKKSHKVKECLGWTIRALVDGETKNIKIEIKSPKIQKHCSFVFLRMRPPDDQRAFSMAIDNLLPWKGPPGNREIEGGWVVPFWITDDIWDFIRNHNVKEGSG